MNGSLFIVEPDTSSQNLDNCCFTITIIIKNIITSSIV